MLGRTHMAIGALGAALTVPMLLHDANAHSMVIQSGRGVLTSVEQITAGIVVGALGGILPDLDQKDALMTRRIEGVGRAATLIALGALLWTLHLWVQPITWLGAFILYLAVVGHAEWMRKVSLILLALGTVGWGVTHKVWLEVAVLAAVWLVVTTFSAHRTFTHSLIGLGIAGLVLMRIGTHAHMPWLAEITLLGYVLHLTADAIAGGISLLWPYKGRQGLRLVTTGGLRDHLIGGVCTLLVLVVVFL